MVYGGKEEMVGWDWLIRKQSLVYEIVADDPHELILGNLGINYFFRIARFIILFMPAYQFLFNTYLTISMQNNKF